MNEQEIIRFPKKKKPNLELRDMVIWLLIELVEEIYKWYACGYLIQLELCECRREWKGSFSSRDLQSSTCQPQEMHVSESDWPSFPTEYYPQKRKAHISKADWTILHAAASGSEITDFCFIMVESDVTICPTQKLLNLERCPNVQLGPGL